MMNNIVFRSFIGFILLTAILAAFYFSKTALFVASVFFIIIAMIEYRKMFKEKNIFPHRLIPEAAGIICAFIFIFSSVPIEQIVIMPTIIFSVIFSFILTVILNKKPYMLSSLSTIAAIILIICGLYIIKLTYYFQDKNSFYFILTYFLSVLSGDYFASVIGQKIKSKYFVPEISPQKTVAGVFANYLATCTLCLSMAVHGDFSVVQCIILGIIISTFSQFGDLTVSTIKRDLGIKHSGKLFLNYGGILDRMDAFIFSAPAAYYCLIIFSFF